MNLVKSTFFKLLCSSIVFFSLSAELFANIDAATYDVGTVREGVLHVTPVEAAQLIDQNVEIKVLDVRTGWEYKRGHVEGAENLNYYSFGFKKALNMLDKKTIWLIHCKSGVRSGRTIPIMKEAGFESIIHMDGGFDAWKEAGLTVNK